jgi:hypothetical protein
VWDGVEGCMDFSDVIRRVIEAEVPDEPAFVDCMMDEISDEDIRESAIELFADDDEDAFGPVVGSAAIACQHLAPPM